MRKGKFIVLEGLDGSGKSTHTMLLAQSLSKAVNQECFTTREPSDSEVGKLIRRALTKQIELLPATMAYLFAADRFEHVVTELIPRLEAGIHVICDRYYLSNFAYQCQSVNLDTLIFYNQPSINLLRPDITVFLDLDPRRCVERMSGDRRGEQIYEGLETLEKVKQGYFKVIDKLKDTETIRLIDAEASEAEVAAKVLDVVLKVF